MVLNNKYNVFQAPIAREIADIKAKQRYYRRKWLDLDTRIIALKKLLNDEVNQ